MILKGEELAACRTHAHELRMDLLDFHIGGAELERKSRVIAAVDYMDCDLTPKGVRLEDLRIDKKMELGKSYVQLLVRWIPRTATVEFYGGPYDGTIRQLQRIGEPVQCHVGPSLPSWSEQQDPDAPVTSTTLLYELEGWNLSKHLWTYRLSKPNLPATKEA